MVSSGGSCQPCSLYDMAEVNIVSARYDEMSMGSGDWKKNQRNKRKSVPGKPDYAFTVN